MCYFGDHVQPSSQHGTAYKSERIPREKEVETIHASSSHAPSHTPPATPTEPFPGSTSPKGGATAENDRHLSPSPSPPAATSPQDNWVQVSARTTLPARTPRRAYHQQPPRHPFQGLTPSGAEQQLTTTAICPRRPPRWPPPPPKINWCGFRHELLVHRLRAGAHTTSNPQGTLSRG